MYVLTAIQLSAIGLGVLAFVIFGLRMLHRFCVRLEEAGYLYYRNRGGGGVFHELDRLTRPSVEHVVQVRDEVKHQEENIGGE